MCPRASASPWPTLHQAAVARSIESPDGLAVVDADTSLTWSALALRAARVAAHLHHIGVRRGDVVGLFVPRSVDAVVAMLAVLRAGAAWLPLDPSYPDARLRYLARDARASTLLTVPSHRDRCVTHAPDGVSVYTLDALDAPSPDDVDLDLATPDDAAYVIHTSGSTGEPKGVVVEHRNLQHLAAALAVFDARVGDRVAQFAPLGFDASIWELALSLYCGATLVITPEPLRAPGDALLAWLRDEAITHALFTPSLLTLLPGALPSTLRCLVAAGEPLSARVAARFGPGRRMFNMYGPTETTVYATLWERLGDGAPTLGPLIPGVSAKVVDEADRDVADGEPGELLVGGGGVSRGYLHRPELTASRFVDLGERFYRTGDLVRRRADGEYDYLGRIDRQVKVRGFRVEPGEVEAAIESLPGVARAVVALREDTPGDRRLLAWVVSHGAPVDLTAARAALSKLLPDPMMPSALIAIPAVPTTAHGKVDYDALPSPDGARPALSVAFVEPATPTERSLAAIWRAVLGVSPVGLHDDLLDLGGDSLRAARILVEANETFGVTLSPRAALDARTVASLAARIDAAPRSKRAQKALRDPTLARLTSSQQRLWWLHQLDPSNVAYNVATEVVLRGDVDPVAIERALEAVADRHDLLRASVEVVDGAPRFRVRPEARASLDVADLRAMSEPDRDAALEALRRREAATPFDLARAPLWRVKLALVEGGAHLLWTTHHVVIDGWSQTVLLRDFADALDGTLSPPPPRFGDALDDAPADEADLRWWRDALDGAPTVFELPTDGPRALVARRAAATRWVRIPKPLAESLKGVARASGATAFVGLCAAFVALCNCDAGARDVVLATPVAARGSKALSEVVGFFANTVALRTKVDGAMTFRALVDAVKEATLGSLAHAATPLDAVVAAVRPERVDELQPLVQVSFAMQEPWAPRVTREGLSLRPKVIDPAEAPFDLQWDFWEDAGGFEAQVTWRLDACDAAGIDRMIARYLALLSAASTDPARAVSTLLPPWTMPRDARCDEAERALRHGGADAIVRLRTNDRGETERVAWIAGIEDISSGETPSDVTVLPMASMARRDDASIDEVSLRRLPIADDDTARRVEASARAMGITELSVTVRDRAAPADDPASIHVTDLLPEAQLHASAPQTAPSSLPQPAPSTASDERPPAYVNGGPFELPRGSPRTLVEALRHAATTARGITWVDHEGRSDRQPYAALLADATRTAAGLSASGLRAGDVAILHIDDLRGHYTAFWACLLAGVIPVTVGIAPSYDPTHGAAAKLVAVWSALEHPAALTDASRVDAVHGLLGVRAKVIAVEGLPSDAEPSSHEAAHGDVAFIQLTSGSTGTPRCIQMTHRGILRHARSTAAFNNRGEGEVDVNWLPPDHVGPLVACHLADLCNAREQVQAATSWVLGDPLRWLDLLEAHRATHTWSPNFGYKLVAERLPPADGRSWDLSRVTTFMTGGEQVTLEVMRRFAEKVAPYGVRIGALQPSFGMAEACTCVTYQRDFSLPAGFHHVDRASLGGALRFVEPGSPEAVTFVDLGGPVPGVEIRIVDEENRVVLEGTVGRYQLRGAVVTPGYRGDAAANAAAFVGDAWFDTGDLGFLWHGRLALTGRAKDVIIVRGANHPSHELEAAAQLVEGVEPGLAAAVAVDDPSGGTEGAAVFVVLDESHARDPRRVLSAVRAEVARRTGLSPMYVIPLGRDEFPRTSSGKVQRAALRKDLAAGRFRARIRDLDRAEGNERTVPAWFHRPAWRLAPLDDGATIAASTCVVVRGEQQLTEAVIARVRARGWTTLALSADEAVSSAWRDAIAGAGAVLHLATAGAHDDRELATLLSLVNALTSLDAPTRLIVVSTGAQNVFDADRASPDRAMVPALLSAVPHESRSVTVRHVDLALDGDVAERIAREVVTADTKHEVAWRGGHRYVSAIEPLDLTKPDRRPLPFAEGASHVVVGGLGGIGEILCDALLSRWKSHLLVLGRTSADVAHASEAWSRLSQRARVAGASIRYASVDVTDAAALDAATRAFEGALGDPIDGVWHLAGRFDERTLEATDESGLRAALAPQVEGARAIEALLATRPDAMLVAFASVHGQVGGFTLGPYAAASRYLQTWVRDRRAKGHARSWCLAWSQWDDTGMNRASPRGDRARAKGFLPVTPTRGVVSLMASLARDHEAVLIGLDDRNANIARRLVAPPALLQREIDARVVGDVTRRAEVRDRFGARASVTLRRVASLGGEVAATEAPQGPVDEVERRVAAIWCAALGRDRVGARDNFFDLGGHSLLLAQVQQELTRSFGREVAMVELFRRPTVHALAAWLRAPVETRVEAAVDRGKLQRAAMEQQRAARAKARKT